MRGVFDEKEVEPASPKRDTELTLGSGTLLAFFFGLVLLCGLCFGLGYSVGRHGSQVTLASSSPSAGALSAASTSSAAKPLATGQAPPSPPPATTDAAQPTPEASSGTAPAAAAETLPAPSPAAPASAQPAAQPALTHPALTPAVAVSSPGQPAMPANARPAFGAAVTSPSSGGLMVQIAAVSNTEDADVLTTALRKRGYAVVARRDPGDNLIHVRIGPFATVAEANNWKMKLLNDGYNAIVQP